MASSGVVGDVPRAAAEQVDNANAGEERGADATGEASTGFLLDLGCCRRSNPFLVPGEEGGTGNRTWGKVEEADVFEARSASCRFAYNSKGEEHGRPARSRFVVALAWFRETASVALVEEQLLSISVIAKITRTS